MTGGLCAHAQRRTRQRARPVAGGAQAGRGRRIPEGPPRDRLSPDRERRAALHTNRQRPEASHRPEGAAVRRRRDRKSTRLNSSHSQISYAVFCLKKKKKINHNDTYRKYYNVYTKSTSEQAFKDEHTAAT